MVETSKKVKVRTHKNPVLAPGVHRFGKSTSYHKKGIWIKRKNPAKKPVVAKKPLTVEKKIGGEKNGKVRRVAVVRSKRYHPTAAGKTRSAKRTFESKTRLRGSLKPGTVCILLAGRHSGKRVVLMKQLTSGLLLVNGPFKINGVPLRRVNQRYVIATSTRLDVSKYNLPQHLDDKYFRRNKAIVGKERQEQEGDIFAAPKAGYTVSENRKNDQVLADKALLEIIKAHPERKSMFKYLGSPFSLTSGQYAHRMKF